MINKAIVVSTCRNRSSSALVTWATTVITSSTKVISLVISSYHLYTKSRKITARRAYNSKSTFVELVRAGRTWSRGPCVDGHSIYISAINAIKNTLRMRAREVASRVGDARFALTVLDIERSNASEIAKKLEPGMKLTSRHWVAQSVTTVCLPF